MSERTRELAAELRESLELLEHAALARLATALDPSAPAERRRRIEALAQRLADPAHARAAYQALPAGARCALRLLVRLPAGAWPDDLDEAARLLCGPDAGAPARELVARGVACTESARSWLGGPDRRVRLLAPLRRRWAALDEEAAAPPPAPPEISDADDQLEAQRASFVLGVVLAAVAFFRPRATRSGGLHGADERALLDLLATACGGRDRAALKLREVQARGLLRVRDGRLWVDAQALARRGPALADDLAEALARARRSRVLLGMFGELAQADGWVEAARLRETGAVLALQQSDEPVTSVRGDLAALGRLPGVLVREEAGATFHRLARPAPQARAAGGLLVQPNLQIMAPLGTEAPLLARLGSFARLTAADKVAFFTLEEAGVRQAVAEGAGGAELLRLLEENASRGVPSTVARALLDWGVARPGARLVTGTVLLCGLAPTELARLGGPLAGARELAAGVYLVDSDSADAAASLLRRAGIACERVDPDAEPAAEARDAPAALDDLVAEAIETWRSARRF